MSKFLCNVSDETLFLKMSQGDKTAQGVLLARFERFGFQYANQQIKLNNLKNCRDIDFIDVIDDAIYKAFRYYQVGKNRFSTFCCDILIQEIARVANLFAFEATKEKESIRLDSSIVEGSDHEFHDIVSDTTQLSSSEQFDIDNFLDRYENTADPKEKKILKIYLMSKLDIPMPEISKKLGITLYEVRNCLKEAKLLCEQSDTIKLK